MRRLSSCRCFVLATSLALVAAAQPWFVAAARAAETKTSLDLVPADAQLYCSLLRNREQIEIIAKSNWWAKLQAMPAVKMAFESIRGELSGPRGPGAEITKFLADPENKALLDVLTEMFSDEVFFYGDKNVVEFVSVYAEANNASNFGVLFKMIEDGPLGVDQNQARTAALFESLAENADRIAVPQLVFGFRIKDTGAAAKQLKRLEILKAAIVESAPDLKDRFKQVSVPGADFWTLELEGSMVPFDAFPLELFEVDKEKMKKLFDKLKSLKVSISLGIIKGHVLLSIGPNNDHLAKLGTGKPLADVKELDSVKKFLDRRVTSIGYLSKEAARTLVTGEPKSIEYLFDGIKGGIAELPLADDVKKRIGKDLDEFSKDLAKYIPEPGAMTGVEFLTDRGYEGYEFNWSKNRYSDGSQKLPILNHVGGAPLMFWAGRSKSYPEDYDLLVKFLTRAHGYFEEFGVPELDDEDREVYTKLSKKLKPIVKKMDANIRENWIPALKDGQAALVIDAPLGSKQWLALLPPTERELKLPQPALVYGLSDSAKFKKALDGCYESVNEILAAIREVAPDEIPFLKLPPLMSRELPDGSGSVHWAPLPKEAGIDERIAPNYGVSKSFGVMSLSPVYTHALLKDQSLKLAGPLANVDRPLVSAAHFNFAGVVDLIEPWVDTAIKMWRDLDGDAGGVDPVAAMIADTVRQTAELLKAFRGYSSATYVENGATVTHSEFHFEDVPR